MARRYAKVFGRLVPHAIWRDPEFTGLTPGAQWLWFVLTITNLGEKRYDPEVALGMAHGLTRAELYDWEAELRGTKYSTAFIPRKARRTIAASTRRQVYERDGHACLRCGASEGLSLDHIYPYSLGGSDELENLQTLCRSCNSRKGNKVHALPQSR